MMEPLLPLAAFAAGALASGVLVWMLCRQVTAASVARAVSEAESRARRDELHLREEIARHQSAKATFDSRVEELTRAQAQLKDAFQSLCADALRGNNEQFLQLARTELERVRAAAQADLAQKETAIDALLTPIRDGLAKYDEKLHAIESERSVSFGAIAQRLDLVAAGSELLRTETANLSKALRSSNVRGAWGELQLRRAVELAGMIEHCDFETQHSVSGDDGALRPDMIVRLPGDRTVVVDAKTPATALLEAVSEGDEAKRRRTCADLVAQLRRHADALSRKSYWEQFESSPDFVVLFLPSEAFLGIALEHDRALFEDCFANRVVLATPVTLLALLKALALGWRQEAIARNAREISDLGRDLYDRIRTLGAHFDSVGDHLGKSVAAYNKAVGSLERRVLPAARRFEELQTAGPKAIGVLESIDITPMVLNAPELRLPAPDHGERASLA